MAGNANSGRRQEKPFRDALKLEIAAVADDDPKSLRMIARKLLEMAAAGDMQAIKELADRADGKVPQGVIGGDPDDPPISTNLTGPVSETLAFIAEALGRGAASAHKEPGQD